jgi:hypothetical protein
MKYKILINWSGQIHTFYRHATTKTHALSLGCQRLEEMLGYNQNVLFRKLIGTNKFDVSIVK